MGYFKKENLPIPQFETIGEGFQVTVFASDPINKETSKDTTENGGVNDGVNGGVTEGVNEVLQFIKENPGLKTNEIKNRLNLSQRTTERWIKQLREDQKIEFKGAPKTGGYFIKNKNADQ